MSAWERIVSVAVVGTERQEPSVGPVRGALGDLLDRLPAGDREAKLLGAAAAVSLHGLAGALPAKHDGPLPSECDAEARRVWGPRSEGHLALMLDGQFAEALPEWLAAAGAAGVVASHGLLPGLLDLAAKDDERGEAIRPLLGERGRWLATQNPDWTDVIVPGDAALWETEARSTRRAMLKRLRASDPARARELVASTWAEESPEDRAGFVELMRRGLGPEDEPFLEAALDDRRKEVRVAAAGALSALPGSRFQARMAERLRPLLAFTPKRMLSKARLEVTLPEGRDAAMARDGLEERGGDGVGVRAFLLVQLLSAVDPSVWSRAWRTTPADLVERTDLGEWAGHLFTGWATAARNVGDSAWAEALQRRLIAGDSRFNVEGLVWALEPGRREALALELLRKPSGPLETDDHALRTLASCDHAWSDELGRGALDAFARRLAPGPKTAGTYYLQLALKALARRLPPSLVERAATALAAATMDDPAWSEQVDRALTLLRFRREALDDLAAGR